MASPSRTADKVGTTDTAARSLQHWSEDGRAGMEAFYTLATEDYRRLVGAADWSALLGGHARDNWQLLDVACGSGQFPAALLRTGTLDSLPPVKAAIARVERALGQDGRVLVRYSGTEAKARVMIEGVDEASIRAYAEDIAECLRTSLAQA